MRNELMPVTNLILKYLNAFDGRLWSCVSIAVLRGVILFFLIDYGKILDVSNHQILPKILTLKEIATCCKQ